MLVSKPQIGVVTASIDAEVPRQRIYQPYFNNYTFYYFGLSNRLNVTMVYAQCNESGNFYEYRHVSRNQFMCVSCKKLGMHSILKFLNNVALNHAHHDNCEALPEDTYRNIQIRRWILADMCEDEIQIVAHARFLS